MAARICLTLLARLLPSPGEESFLTEPGCCCGALAGCGVRCTERGDGAQGRVWISTSLEMGKPLPAWRTLLQGRAAGSGAWRAALCGESNPPVSLHSLGSVVWPGVRSLLGART